MSFSLRSSGSQRLKPYIFLEGEKIKAQRVSFRSMCIRNIQLFVHSVSLVCVFSYVDGYEDSVFLCVEKNLYVIRDSQSTLAWCQVREPCSNIFQHQHPALLSYCAVLFDKLHYLDLKIMRE